MTSSIPKRPIDDGEDASASSSSFFSTIKGLVWFILVTIGLAVSTGLWLRAIIDAFEWGYDLIPW